MGHSGKLHNSVPRARSLPLLGLLALAVDPLTACDDKSTGASTSPHEATGSKQLEEPEGSVRLVLNNPSGRKAPEDTCEVELCTSLLEMIQGAQKSIDFALYGMRDQSEIMQAIQRAKERGVKVRGVVDRDIHGDNYYSSTEQLIEIVGDAWVKSDMIADQKISRRDKREYKNAGSKDCEAPDGFNGYPQCLVYEYEDQCLNAVHASREPFGEDKSAIMHNKFFIVDGEKLWTGSTNVSDSGTGGYNANLVVRVDSKAIATWYTEEFERMFDKGEYHDFKKPYDGVRKAKVGTSELEVYFSPQDKPARVAVRPLIQDARERIDIGVFFLTHKGITQDLLRAHERGVKVRVILDATAATNGYTKHELLRAVGIPVKVENWGGKMHMKSAAIDGKHLVTGSMNWTSAGDNSNDENTIIIHDEALAAQYHAFFEGIWTSIDDKWLEGRPAPESLDSTTACFDGSDNDFDKLRDADDPSCGDNPEPMPDLPPHWFTPREKITCQFAPAPAP